MSITVTVVDYTPKPSQSMFEPVIATALELPEGKAVEFSISTADVPKTVRILRELASSKGKTARVDTFPNEESGETALKVWVVDKMSRPRKPKPESTPDDVQTVEAEPVAPAAKRGK